MLEPENGVGEAFLLVLGGTQGDGFSNADPETLVLLCRLAILALLPKLNYVDCSTQILLFGAKYVGLADSPNFSFHPNIKEKRGK